MYVFCNYVTESTTRVLRIRKGNFNLVCTVHRPIRMQPFACNWYSMHNGCICYVCATNQQKHKYYTPTRVQRSTLTQQHEIVTYVYIRYKPPYRIRRTLLVLSRSIITEGTLEPCTSLSPSVISTCPSFLV